MKFLSSNRMASKFIFYDDFDKNAIFNIMKMKST